MRLNKAAMISLAILALPVVAWSKGETIQIDIDGADLTSPIEITDPAIVSKFNIWNGPGVSTSSYGVPNPPAYLDPNRPAGRFIDWPEGIIKTRPENLDRYQVTFRIARRTPEIRFRVIKSYTKSGQTATTDICICPNFPIRVMWADSSTMA